MRTDTAMLTVADLDNCNDTKTLKAVIRIQAGLLKNRDRTIIKLRSELKCHLATPHELQEQS